MIELTPATVTFHLILQILTRHKIYFMCVCVLLSSQKYVSFNYKY